MRKFSLAAIHRLPSGERPPPCDDAVEVGMVEERLRPGVEDGDKADVRAQVFGICREFFEGPGSGFE